MLTPVRVHHVDQPERGFVTRVILDVGTPNSVTMTAKAFEHLFGDKPMVGRQYTLTTAPAAEQAEVR